MLLWELFDAVWKRYGGRISLRVFFTLYSGIWRVLFVCDSFLELCLLSVTSHISTLTVAQSHDHRLHLQFMQRVNALQTKHPQHVYSPRRVLFAHPVNLT